jgi:hypothetical protein
MENNLTNPKDLLGATKPQLHLVPPSALVHMAKGMEYGGYGTHLNGKKIREGYGPYNWRDKKVRATVYVAAALRHLLSYLDGEDEAQDSGVLHLAHAADCCAILIDAQENNCLLDDRPKKGNTAELIAKLTVRPAETA